LKTTPRPGRTGVRKTTEPFFGTLFAKHQLFINSLEIRMKKTLILATGLSAFVIGAQAQSTVQLMGLADVYTGSMRMAGDAVSKSV
jgi:hypothetical protein